MGAAAPVEFERSSVLAAPASQVWARVATMDGVNDELAPLVRMTHPATLSTLTDAGDELLGRVVFHSWLLAGGVVPMDRHALRLLAVEQRGELGGGFVEDSTSWLQARWRHERDVEAIDAHTCVVTDRLVVVPRLRVARPVVSAVVPRIFEHRHRVLRARFGTSTDQELSRAAGPARRRPGPAR